MKSRAVRPIGIVVGDEEIRAVQELDGNLVSARVPRGDDLKRCMRQLLTSSPFAGRSVAVGIEGRSVLVESLVVPSSTSSTPYQICAERLKGDPVFNEEDSALGVSTSKASGPGGESMVILAAVLRDRIQIVLEACRELALDVRAVEAAPLASWRAWEGRGNQIRLVRTDRQDIVLAGTDDKLAFCRVVDGRLSAAELRATIGRAAALFAGSFDELVVDGELTEDMRTAARGLGLAVSAAPDTATDASSLGLSRDGSVLAEFTPPEMRDMRVRQQVRKARFGLIAAGAVAVVVAGLFSWRQVVALEIRKSQLETDLRLEEQARVDLAGLESRFAELRNGGKAVLDARPGHLTSRLFAVLVNSAPDDLLLEAVQIQDLEIQAKQESKGRRRRGNDADEKPKGPTPRRLVINVSGLAGSNTAVNGFAANLLASEAFTDVRVETSERILLENSTDGEHFRIHAEAETR